ncbi:WD40-repeat-containing domain protein [Dichotomocladium elegans]|nr:WD40-repeat-containing domain protein [Dichotomocladium elegans]
MSEHEHDIIVDGDSPCDSSAKASDPPLADDYKDMDDIDTDDLLEEAEITLKPRAKSATKKKTRTTQRRGIARAKSTEDMELDDPKKIGFDPERTKQLAEQYPDNYWKFHADSGYNMIDRINDNFSLEPVPCNMSDQAAITSMTLSADGALLATFSNIGAVKIWDIENDFKLVRKLRDGDEQHIDEFYCGKFASDTQELIVVGGKLKDRHRWSTEDEDNHILPCPIKIFHIEQNKVLSTLHGHEEEILCIKTLMFNGENYYISTSQDGYIIKWHMDSDWTTLIESTKMEDGATCMAFTVSFVPNTGNKFFLAACDENLRLYDFEDALLLQTFENIYSSYCDCGKFISWLDEPLYLAEQQQQQQQQKEDISATVYAYFISRGAEMCDVDDGVSSIPNTCTLHKLVYPTEQGGKFELEEVKRYKHEDYHANSWLVKITSNGRYILAPTIYGQIFVFNMLSGQVTAILKEHEDGFVKVYTYKSISEDQQAEELDVGTAS